MPDWLTVWLAGQEMCFHVSQGNARETAPSMTEADLGRAAVSHITRLRQIHDSAPSAVKSMIDRQVLQIHTFLSTACAKYKADACLAEPPLPPPSPPPLSPGTVLIQWYTQDGSWKDPLSWNDVGGHTTSTAPSNREALKLRTPSMSASALYTIATSTGVKSGELVLPVSVTRRLQAKVSLSSLQHQ
jgi:hypothetical protein